MFLYFDHGYQPLGSIPRSELFKSRLLRNRLNLASRVTPCSALSNHLWTSLAVEWLYCDLWMARMVLSQKDKGAARLTALRPWLWATRSLIHLYFNKHSWSCSTCKCRMYCRAYVLASVDYLLIAFICSEYLSIEHVNSFMDLIVCRLLFI